MPKLNTTVKAVRIDNDKLSDLITRLDGQTINAWLNNQIDSYLNHKTESKGVNPIDDNVPPDVWENIVSMAEFCDGGLTGLLMAVNKMLEDGVLDTDLRVHKEKWVENFEETCHEFGLPVEKAAESAMKALKKGGL